MTNFENYMSKHIQLFLLLVLGVFISNCGGPKIVNPNVNTDQIQFFEGTWEEALALAKKEKKFLFVDFYAEWCGPCKLMERDVFTDYYVAAFYNEKFINYRVDVDKGEGPVLKKKFQIRAYPSLYFISHTEEVIEKREGYHGSQSLIRYGKKVLRIEDEN